jgi:hypothetical protein
MILTRVISGGQSGADQGGWRAAKAAGIPTGGLMPRGFLTEDGLRPNFARLYGAREHFSSSYPPRTRANIEEADATFIFAENHQSKGTVLASNYAYRMEKPCVVVKVVPGPIPPERPAACARWLIEKGIRVLNVAGNRESTSPGIGVWVESYLADVFRILRETP